MASPAYRLTHDDTVFVNALTVLLLPVIQEDDEVRIWHELAIEVRRGVNRDHTYMGPLVEAFDAWDRAEDVMMRERARLHLVGHLAAFIKWRGALADRARKTQAAA